MKDFARVFILIALVAASVAGFAYLAFRIGYMGMALLQLAVSTAIIILFIRYVGRSHRPPDV
ncbi:hypothetical protein SAMN05421823_11033 [Catalinimonas alkaloidigena]|uniref:Uncharacterized protein n=1 Tax=Catalinimonas alkaloidigena TaxID=1075417 RepID=A0A1G9Q4U9_9BACT|nr:hypothetical protein [Catalinimonas alkaloidigena]SDM05771.1 hypothetical protein SAMN05421823_11033 [Catalinimonas alkaloidigena]